MSETNAIGFQYLSLILWSVQKNFSIHVNLEWKWESPLRTHSELSPDFFLFEGRSRTKVCLYMVSSVPKAQMGFVIFSLGAVFAALGLERVRWCTVSEPELSKCNDMSKAFSEAGILPPLECTAGGSAANCTQMIKVSCEWHQCH